MRECTETGREASDLGKTGSNVLSGTFYLGFGVLLPLFALVLELLSGMCAGIFFDPIPTPWHALLVLLVPAANAAGYVAFTRPREPRWRLVGWANGVAAGVALYYAIVFLPLTPFACIGVLWFGIGLIPLAPLISFLVALRFRSRLKARAGGAGARLRPKLWQAMLAAVAILVALEAPKAATLAGVRMAASEDGAVRAQGLQLLRRWGSDEILLRACYGVRKPVTDILSYLYGLAADPVPAGKIQDIYYKVTGTPYNAVRPPDIRGLRGGALIDADEFDVSQGTDQVAARIRGLGLKESRIDGVVDAVGGTAYVEWTLVFRNASTQQREARAQLALPPGGVVSRLTLWIDGEEREAAFGGRSQVKEAYQKVVARRRDPVLVTTSGPDQVLLQCFPVPPNGGEMKVRVGITAPLFRDDVGLGRLRLPFFAEQNFGTAAEFGHSVWIEGNGVFPKSPLQVLAVEQPSPSTFAMRGRLSDAQLGGPFSAAVSGLKPPGAAAWCEDPRQGTGTVVRQTLREEKPAAPRRVVIVVDGSRRMAAHAGEVAAALAKCPASAEWCVILAGDEEEMIQELGPCSAQTRDAAARKLAAHRFEGGCDNVPALLKAWELAAGSPAGAIVWFHATQPVQMTDSQALLQRWERRPDNPVLYDFQFGGGRNMVAETLNGCAAVKRLPSFGEGPEEAGRLFAQWNGASGVYAYDRRQGMQTDTDLPVDKGSFHMARLWAFDRVRGLAASRAGLDRAAALELAMTYQLVTPVSGAVVLETKKQYDEAGLHPVDAETTPQVVPEPETWALLIVGLAIVALCRRRWLCRC